MDEIKICVTSRGATLDSEVDPRFGRCAYFLFIVPETMAVESVENVQINASGGAGIQAGQLAAEKGVRAVLTGSVGPNAFETLHAAGIDSITGVAGTVREAVEMYKSGALKPGTGPTAAAHHGMR